MFQNVFFIWLAAIGTCLAKDNLTVFYDPLENTSKLFIVSQLYPVLLESTNLSLNLVPYGKLILDEDPEEEESYIKNKMLKMHTCVTSENGLDDIEKLLVVECMMKSKIVPLTNIYLVCMSSEEIKTSVNKCVNYGYDPLLNSNVNLIEGYRVRKLPFVLINGDRLTFMQNEILANLKRFLQTYEFCKTSNRLDDPSCYQTISSSAESVHFLPYIGFIVSWFSVFFCD